MGKIHIILGILLLSIAISGVTSVDKYLKWTTVGDDINDGICTGYVIKTALTADSLEFNWNDCRVVDTIWNTENAPAGVLDSFLIELSHYESGTHFFSMKAFDEVFNVSDFGNTAQESVDNMPPAPVQCSY